ncbi:MAG: hypothetical protein JXB34_04765 [Bacteroidales bacterium]|nr:hypothetical protein [Bacteroidales bacterium]
MKKQGPIKQIGFCSIVLFLLVPQFKTNAQLQYPSKVNWVEINAPHFKVICPAEIAHKGQETANLLEKVYFPVSAPLKITAKPISLVLNSQSVISNGYMALGPRHMSWYITPMQDVSESFDGSSWFELLALHEFRHTVQYDKLDAGFTDFAGDALGDIGRAIFINLAIPNWYFEGDAIYSETVNSLGGRGRLPSFAMYMMAPEMENKRYSYDKAYLRSYRHYIPNHYYLGYLMTTHINRNYGEPVWNELLDMTSRSSFWPYSFSINLKTKTGHKLSRTYKNMLDEYRLLWDEARKKQRMAATKADTVFHHDNKGWNNYTFPTQTGPDQFLTVKYGLSEISTLVMKENNNETILGHISPIDRVQSNGQYITWSAKYTDARWGQKEYADIVLFDPETKTRKRLTRQQRYFAPALSPSGSKIATIEYTSDMECSLVILDANTGLTIDRYPAGNNEFFRMPSWSADEKQITFSVTEGQKKTIAIVNTETRKIKHIVPYTSENVTNPVFYKGFVLFNSSLGDFDEIHAVDTGTIQRYCVATGKYGAINPSVNEIENTLCYQEYTANGYIALNAPIVISDWIELPAGFAATKNYLHHFLPDEKTENQFLVTGLSAGNIYEEKQYLPVKNSIKVHSWQPVFNRSGVGMQVYSDDYLNTTNLIAGVLYYPNDAAWREYVNLTYAGLYPVLQTGLSYGRKYAVMADTNNEEKHRKFDEKLASFTVSLPFDFSENVYVTKLNLEAGYLYGQHKYSSEPFYLSNQTITLSAVYSGLSLSALRHMAPRDIYPPTGFESSLTNYKTVGNKGYKGSRTVLSGTAYLPGAMPHHSIKLDGGFRYNNGDLEHGVYFIETNLGRVRGHKLYSSEQYLKGTISYTLPLVYPDMGIPSVFFCKRIYTSLFYDHGVYKGSNYNVTQKSVGIDLNFNFHLFRVLALPFDMGLRFSRNLTDNTNQYDLLLFGISF